MEITKDNYDLYEGQIISDIENSDFISVDLEMTGIANYNNSILDYPEGRYLKYRATADRFRIIQLGICTWKRIQTEDGMSSIFISKPYNIYVFPEEEYGQVNCEVGALIFNKENGMDFNKWIYKGVPYMNSKQLKLANEAITDGNINFYDPNDKNKYKNISLYKDEDKARYQEFVKAFSEFMESDHKKYIFDRYPRFFLYYIINNMPESDRKKIYFSYEVIDGKTFLMITKVDENEKKSLLEAEIGQKIVEINKKKGVKKIFDAMVNKKCTLVGHNCSLDITFIISHFGDTLPNTLKEFKAMMKENFREVYDTKFLFENFTEMMQKDNVMISFEKEISQLENVYTSLKTLYKGSLNIQIPEGLTNYLVEANAKYHEASYDAFITGCSFLWMADNLKDNLFKLCNRIFLMRSIFSGINLDDEESYIYPHCYVYCLRAVKKISDIDLKKLIDQTYFEKIKKCYSLDPHNALMILVQYENPLLLSEFENLMLCFPEHFQFYPLMKFKEIIKDEDTRKYEHKNNFK